MVNADDPTSPPPCRCTWRWGSHGVLYGVDMGQGWLLVERATADCDHREPLTCEKSSDELARPPQSRSFSPYGAQESRRAAP